MAINTQKFLPASKGGTGAKISQKNVSTQGFSSIFSGKTIKNISVIKVKVIQIEKIFWQVQFPAQDCVLLKTSNSHLFSKTFSRKLKADQEALKREMLCNQTQYYLISVKNR